MINLGIVGPGLIWHRVHKPIVARMGDRLRVVAFAARSESTRLAALQDFPAAATYSDYRELIAAPDVDAVVVLTPIQLNAPVATDALAAGKPAILEKPMAASADQAAALMAAEAPSSGAIEDGHRGPFAYVLEQVVHRPEIDAIRDTIAAGRIGEVSQYVEVRHGRLSPGSDDSTGGFGDTDWRINTAFPLGSLFDGGVHEIALLKALFGTPRSVQATGVSLRPEFGEWDTVNAVFSYEDDRLLGYLNHSGYLPGGANRLAIHGQEATLILEKELPPDRRLRIRAPEGTEQIIPVPDRYESRLMWEDISARIHDGVPARYDTAAALIDLETLFAVERALRSGCREQPEHTSRAR